MIAKANAPTVRRSAVSVNAEYPRSRAVSATFRQDAARADAAQRAVIELPRGTQVGGFNARKIGELRTANGSFADVAAYLIARPESAQVWASFYQGIADSVTELEAVDVIEAADAEQEVDGKEDVAGLRAQREMTPDAIREHLRLLDLHIARARELKRGYLQLLEAMH